MPLRQLSPKDTDDPKSKLVKPVPENAFAGIEFTVDGSFSSVNPSRPEKTLPMSTFAIPAF